MCFNSLWLALESLGGPIFFLMERAPFSSFFFWVQWEQPVWAGRIQPSRAASFSPFLFSLSAPSPHVIPSFSLLLHAFLLRQRKAERREAGVEPSRQPPMASPFRAAPLSSS